MFHQNLKAMKKIMYLIAAMMMTVLAAHAQEKKDVAKPGNSSIARIQLANELAKYGYETYSASALIEAAQILSEVQTQGLDGIKYEQGNGKDVKNENGRSSLSIKQLIADAREYAAGDSTLLGMANRVKVEENTTRGAVGGPKSGSTVVYGGSTDTYTIYFKSGIPAEVAVSGNGATDLDLYIYDEHGNIIEKDDDYSDDCYVCWVPRWTGNFIVKVVNRGRYNNYYRIATN